MQPGPRGLNVKAHTRRSNLEPAPHCLAPHGPSNKRLYPRGSLSQRSPLAQPLMRPGKDVRWQQCFVPRREQQQHRVNHPRSHTAHRFFLGRPRALPLKPREGVRPCSWGAKRPQRAASRPLATPRVLVISRRLVVLTEPRPFFLPSECATLRNRSAP